MSTPVHDTTHPLSALKQIPPMSPALTPTFKRPAAAQLAKSPKKVKIARPTPEPFKVPYLPTRALTPSTSTAAFSSSPPRLLPSSPPASTTTKHAQVRDVPMDPIHLSAGTALIFGRHRHSQQASHTSATLRASVPSHLRHLVSDIDSPAEIVLLAQSARHASRVHAVAEYTEDTDQIRVTVIGQNGLRLNGTDRLLPGQRAELGRRDDLSISFYGTSTRLIFPAKSHSERLFTPVTEEEEEMASSLPPSSPPLGRRASTPLSDEEAHPTRPIAPTSEPAPSEREIKVEIISSAVAKLSTSPKILQVESGIDASAPAPGGVDLPALLASTVVFSGSSKLSLPDLVKHMLEVSLAPC